VPPPFGAEPPRFFFPLENPRPKNPQAAGFFPGPPPPALPRPRSPNPPPPERGQCSGFCGPDRPPPRFNAARPGPPGGALAFHPPETKNLRPTAGPKKFPPPPPPGRLVPPGPLGGPLTPEKPLNTRQGPPRPQAACFCPETPRAKKKQKTPPTPAPRPPPPPAQGETPPCVQAKKKESPGFGPFFRVPTRLGPRLCFFGSHRPWFPGPPRSLRTCFFFLRTGPPPPFAFFPPLSLVPWVGPWPVTPALGSRVPGPPPTPGFGGPPRAPGGFLPLAPRPRPPAAPPGLLKKKFPPPGAPPPPGGKKHSHAPPPSEFQFPVTPGPSPSRQAGGPFSWPPKNLSIFGGPP